MGLRIQKNIGYGLLYLEENDSRVNMPDSNMLHETTVRDLYFFAEKFAMGIDEMLPPRMYCGRTAHLKGGSPHFETPLANYIVVDDEYGEENVLLLQVPFMDDWSRRDNIIDYMEAGQDLSGPNNEAYELNGGIYPFIGTWQDSRTGQVAPHGVEIKRAMNHAIETGDRKYLEGLAVYPETIAPFKTVADAEKYIMPSVPWDIIMLCRFLNLFKSDTTLLQLRPIYYQFWS